jgi:hypothetical protein
VEYLLMREGYDPDEASVSLVVETRLDEALHQICESAGEGFGWTVHEGKVVIGKTDRLPAPAIKRAFPAAETERTVSKLDQPISMSFRDTPLAGALEYFQQVTNANFAWRRGRAGGISERPVTVALETSLGKALDLLCESAGDDLGWAVYGGVVRIGLKEDLSGTDVDPDWPEWQKGLAARHLNDIVRAPRAGEAPPLSFLDAVTYLSQILPARGLCFFAVRRDVPAEPAEFVLLTGIALREALDDLCEQAGMAWAADGPLIRIGTPQRILTAVGDVDEMHPESAREGLMQVDVPALAD